MNTKKTTANLDSANFRTNLSTAIITGAMLIYSPNVAGLVAAAGINLFNFLIKAGFQKDKSGISGFDRTKVMLKSSNVWTTILSFLFVVLRLFGIETEPGLQDELLQMTENQEWWALFAALMVSVVNPVWKFIRDKF